MTRKMFQPVEHENRNCFGIAWFKTEHEANEYDLFVKEMGYTYTGGFQNGRSCGRDAAFDKEIGGVKLFAVTD